MNKSHINRYWGIKILDWCVENIGPSKYHDKPPSLRMQSKNPSDSFGLFNSLTNVILIYIPQQTSFTDFVRTIIHEYTHHTQDITGMYDKIMKDVDYEEHPFELEARDNERRLTKRCLKDLKKFLK